MRTDEGTSRVEAQCRHADKEITAMTNGTSNRTHHSSGTKRRMTVFLALLSAACGGGGGGGGDGGVSDSTGVAGPDPMIHGDLCGDVTDTGFEISCLINAVEFVSTSRTISDALQDCPAGSCGFSLPTLFPNAKPCCEGSAPEPTADAECQETCMQAACLQARQVHRSVIDSTCIQPIVGDEDGFDLAGCTSGAFTSHTIQCSAFCLGFGACGNTYDLQVTCDAQTNEPYNEDGTFGFIDTLPDNDPPTCMGSSALVHEPDEYPLQDSVEEAVGSRASVAWSAGSYNGIESATDLSVDISYDLVSCSAGTCLQLAQLDVVAPDFLVEGISVSSPRLTLVGVGSEPSVNVAGSFSFPPGSLEVLVEYVVLGTRQHLIGTNSGTMVGRIVPGSDLFELSSLQFDYADPGISATLTLDISGSYTKRAPVASFVTLSVPRLCSQQVEFFATSSDEDGDPISHHWEVDGRVVETGDGDTLSVQLAAGAHSIILLAEDDDGRHDIATMEYNRACT